MRSSFAMIGGVSVTLFFAGMLILHMDYYLLPRHERPLHDMHDLLRSSGTAGLWLGIAAATLFILNLGYLVRKRLIRINWLGPLRKWMDIHVVTGLVGLGLVLLHSAMAPSSALGILALAALVITVLTGLVGRTIYIRVPRSVEGRELEFMQVQEELDACRVLLEDAGVHAEWLAHSDPQVRPRRTVLVGGFVAMVTGDIQRRKDYRLLKSQILAEPELNEAGRKVLPLARDYCIHWQWLVRYHELRNLIASWRFFHRWLAVLMLCVVLGHVFVALRYGNLALLGGSQ
jgi:hypothetical protein